jgi:predicted transcriptional regulator
MTTLTFRLDEKLERALDRLAKSTGRLPGLSFKVRHDVEVLVSAEHGSPCSSARAAIQALLAGIGRPECLRATRSVAYAIAVVSVTGRMSK